MSNINRSAELEEIWALFAQEGRDNLLLAEESLLALEKDPRNAALVAALFRAIHSFKGGARMMGLSVMESLAHRAEDLIALVRDEGASLEKEMLDLLLTTLDRLRAMLDYVLAHGQDVEPSQVEGLAASLEELIARASASIGKPTTAIPAPTTDSSLPAVNTTPSTAQSPIELVVREELLLPEPTPESTLVQAETKQIESAASDVSAALDLASFLRAAESQLALLHSAFDSFPVDSENARAQIHSVSRALTGYAKPLGYLRLASELDDLDAQAQADLPPNPTPQEIEERLIQLKKQELCVFEELTRVQESSGESKTKSSEADVTEWSNVAWLFRHWNAERVFADLTRLTEIANRLDELERQFASDGSTSGKIERLADEATVHLRAIHHSCIFYDLDQAVHLTLALEDLFGRVAQSELLANAALTSLTRAFVTNLGSALEAVQEGEDPALETLVALIQQAENFLYLSTDGPIYQVTRNILDVLDLPLQFKEVMTPETLAQFSRALQAKEQFYTLLADLERDDAPGQAFFEWSHSDGIHLITNITVYRYQRTLFSFLLSTSSSRESVIESLVKMDPTWQYLTLQECKLLPEFAKTGELGDVRPQASREPATLQEDSHPSDHNGRNGTGVSAEIVESLLDTVGRVMADQTTSNRMVERLNEVVSVEEVLGLMQTANGDWREARRGLTALLAGWTASVRTLGQANGEIGNSLGRIHELVRSLRLTPAAEILNPLRRVAQELAHRQGKLVELDLQGAELELDRDAMRLLAEPIRRLVWFAVMQGLENVERRQGLGKSSTGHIIVRVIKHEDHVQVIVDDDGQGIDREMVLRRAQELGWIDGNGTDVELALTLKPGFGPVTSASGTEGIDLAALDAELRIHQGRISLTSEKGQGTHFDIRLPLDMTMVDGMIVRVGEVRYVVPVSIIRRIVTAEAHDVVHSSADGTHTLLRFENELVQLQDLAGNGVSNGGHNLVMIVEGDKERVALTIDELIGRQQVLVRPLQGALANVRDASGCALLGEGQVGVVLNRDLTVDHAYQN